jgi:hypothetical protein
MSLSRTFECDDVLYLCPIADYINHSNEGNVRIDLIDGKVVVKSTQDIALKD